MSEVLAPELIVLRFIAFAEAGRNDRALALVQDQIGHHLDNERLWYLLAAGLAASGELKESERAVHKALALVPDLLPALILLGQLRSAEGQPDEAVNLALHAVAKHPDDPTAHLAVASAHFARRASSTDLGIALQAARNVTGMSREHEEAFAIGARAADALGHTDEALRLLREGLAEHPNSSKLLEVAGKVDGARRVVGDRAPLLRSSLAANPFDEGSAEQLHQLTFDHLRMLFYLPWFQGILFGMAAGPLLPHRGVAAGLALLLTAAVAGVFLLSFRRLENRLPKGYLRGDICSAPPVRTALYAAAAGTVWVGSSALWAALSGGSPPAGAALALAALPVAASLELLGRAQYPALIAVWAEQDLPARRWYWNGRLQQHLSTRVVAWAGLVLGIAGLSVAGLSEADVRSVAGGGLCLAALLWLVRAVHLIRLQAGLGNDNPFVVGNVMQAPASKRDSARRQGKYGAASYTFWITVIPLVLLIFGADVLISNVIPE